MKNVDHSSDPMACDATGTASKGGGKIRQSLHTERDRILRFVLVGMVNTTFGYGVFSLGILFGFNLATALLFSTVLGVIFNFFSNGIVVFRNADLRNFHRFVFVYGVIYLVNLGLLKIMTKAASLSPFAAQAISLPITVLMAYAMLRFIVYRNSQT
jgi:putative flippase GtrA